MNLADRIKRYESVSHYGLTARTPVMIRVDGRAFHSFTKGMARPFDNCLMDAMTHAAFSVANDMQGFKAAYIQSDEATFCITDYDKLDTQGWFDYDLQKIVSISAALMTTHFSRYIVSKKTSVFDSRAFNIPSSDVVNAFVWRARDWGRNSLQMYCRSHFSHKQLHGKCRADMHEMLHGIGRNWATDLKPREKNGTFLRITEDGIISNSTIEPTYADINNSIGDLFAYPDTENAPK